MDRTHHAPGLSLRDLARRCGAELSGDGGVMIDRVATLDGAGPGAIGPRKSRPAWSARSRSCRIPGIARNSRERMPAR